MCVRDPVTVRTFVNYNLLKWLFIIFQKACTFFLLWTSTLLRFEECGLCCSFATTTSIPWLCRFLHFYSVQLGSALRFFSSIATKFLYVLGMCVSLSQKFCWGFSPLLHVWSVCLYTLITIFWRPAAFNMTLVLSILLFFQKPCTSYFIRISLSWMFGESLISCSSMILHSVFWLYYKFKKPAELAILLL